MGRQRQPGVEVSMIGFTPPGWSCPRLFGGATTSSPVASTWGTSTSAWPPWTRNAWADGKSDVKAMEYAMAGVLPILEDAPPY